MMKFLDGMMKEAKDIDPEKFKPEDPVSRGERIVGKLGKEHRKLYALARRYMEKGDAVLDLELRRTLGHKVRMREREPATVLYGKGKALTDIFWASIKGTHGLWGENIGIRKGWKIVRISTKEIPNKASPFDFRCTFIPRH